MLRAAPQSGCRSRNPQPRGPSLIPPARRRLVRSTATLVVALVLALAFAACGGPKATPGLSIPPGAIVITAKDTAFDRTELFLPADTTFSLFFDNEDVDLHNVAIRTQRGFEGELLFRMDPIGTFTAEVPAGPFAEGTYYFICEVHPVMSGTVIVQ